MLSSRIEREPAAILPMIMSAVALAAVIVHVALFGTARQADEGAAAHIWQLMMAGQLPIIAYFAVKHLGDETRPALRILAVQIAAALAAMAPVYLLGF